MNHKLLITAGVMSMGLLGCTITNRFDYPPNTAQSTTSSNHRHRRDEEVDKYPDHPLAVEDAKPPVKEKGACPPFKLPNLGKPPPLPYAELAKINPQDNNALDHIEQQHIRDVRGDAIRVRQVIERSYSKYLADCKRYQSGK